MNYFTLIEDIKRTSLQFAEEFYEGDIYEFLNSGNHKYPSIILTTQNVSTTDNINSISGTLFCVDRLTDDSSNRLEIQSNSFNKLQRIISALEENTINLQSNTYTPFTEKFADLCGGMFVEFSFQYVGESICEDLEIKEIELTQNGIYDVIGYDRAIVNVKPVVNLEDITITDNGEYTCGEGFDGFGKVNVDLRGKVNVSSFKVTNDCINSEGRWEGEEFIGKVNSLYQIAYNCSELKELNANHWDTSSATTLAQAFYKCSKLKTLNIKDWDTSNVTTLAGMFESCGELQEIDINNWDVSKVTSIDRTFLSSGLKRLDISNWDTSKVKSLSYLFYGMNNLEVADISNFNASSVADSPIRPFYLFSQNFHSLVGERTIEDVINNNIGVFIGLKYSLAFDNSSLPLDRASLRAIINGLAEVETTQTLRLGSLKAKLTEEDIAIATNKNWTIT